jgi:non-ribosomal peptide synthase protein (TIGR01720 family)
LVIAHHLAVDGVSWRILLEDLNLAWTQHRTGQQVALPAPGTSFQRWASLLAEHAHDPEVEAQAQTWREIAAVAVPLPAVQPVVDTYANAGSLSVDLDPETTRMLLREVPAAFHGGINDVLLIAYALALAEFLGGLDTDTAPIVIDAEGHGRQEELADDVDLSRTVGWFTTKYPVALEVGGLDWAQVVAGDARLGAVVKDAKEQLRALPDGLSYGVLRYLNDDVDLEGFDSPIGFNYLGRMGAAGAQVSGDYWEICPDGSVAGAAAAIPMPLMHTVELNAGTIDSADGPRLRAGWTWALSALDHPQVNRLSQLWFDALTGICAHVRGGGGGLTPSDIAPARLTQQQIDELCRDDQVADILPLTPLQQGLMFHAGIAHGCGDDVYAVQLDVTLSGRLDQHRLRTAVQSMLTRHPNLAARFSGEFDEPVQVIPVDPETPWRYEDLTGGGVDVDEQIACLCAAERAAVCDLNDRPPFRAVLIRTAADEHRFVLTNHHILLDGWSLPILLGEIFAGYYGHRLPAPAPYRRFISWLAKRDLDAARAAWGEVLAGFDTPTLVGPPDRLVPAVSRRVAAVRVSEETTRAVGELARSRQTTVSTVLQGAWAQLLMSLTGEHDVVFGSVVSGRPTEVVGAESMVGLFINTVPVRASITATTTAADLLDQLQDVRNQTLEHEHLGLNEIHRLTGQDQLFDTVFVYENYPSDATLSGADGLAITGLTNRDHYHYPLTVQAVPGNELDLRVQYRTDVFDEAGIEALIERFKRVLVAMTTDPEQPLLATQLSDCGELAQLNGWSKQPMTTPESKNHDGGSGNRGPATPVEQIVADVFAQVLKLDDVGVEESFFDLGGDSLLAMRAVAAINAAFDTHLALATLFDAPTVRSLSHHLDGP